MELKKMGLSFKEQMLGRLPDVVKAKIEQVKTTKYTPIPQIRKSPNMGRKTTPVIARDRFMRPSISPSKTKIQSLIIQAQALKRHNVTDKIAKQKSFRDILKAATKQATVPVEERNSAVIQITADANAQMWKNVRETELTANAQIEQVMNEVNVYAVSVQEAAQGFIDFELDKQRIEETPDMITDTGTLNKAAVGVQKFSPLIIGAVIIGVIIMFMVIKR